MADNLQLNAGSGGEVLATDDDGTAHHQYVKVEFGADNTQTPVSSANPLPVDGSGVTQPVSAASLPLPTGASTAANQSTEITHLSTIAGDTTSLDGKVTACDTGSVTVASSALPSGAATSANQTTEITHLSEIEGAVETVEGTVATDGSAKKTTSVQVAGEDGTNAQTLKTDTDGHLQIDVLTTPTTTVTGTITETNSGDIKTAVEAIQAGQLADGHNVTVDNAAGASAVNIQDGGNSITVDGSVTANAGTNLNTSALALESGGNLDTIAGDTTSLDGKIAADTVDDLDTGAGTDSVKMTGIALKADGGHVSPTGIEIIPATGYYGLPVYIGNGGNAGAGSAGNPFYIQNNSGAAIYVRGEIAHDAADGGSQPIKVGGKAHTSEPAAVANSDRVNAYFDENGYQHVKVDANALPTGAATETTLDAIKTAVEILDNIVSGSEAQVDVVSSALPTGASTLAEQQTQTTHLSEIEGAVETIEGTVATDGAGKKTVAVQVAGEDGTNAQTLKTDADGHLQVDVLSGGGGGTQYNEDDGHTTGDTGTMALAVRSDSDASLCDTDLDYSPLQLDANGYLKVNIKAGAGSGGTAMTDDDAFTPASSSITPMGAMFDDVTPDSVDEGDAGVVRMSANRNLFSTIRDAAGNERGVNVTAGNALTVDGSGVTQPVSGTVTANLGTLNGAATEAKQDTGNTSLSTIAGDTTSIDGKTPSLGQAVKAASVPVTLASDQEDVKVTLDGETVGVSGTVTANAGTDLNTSALALEAGGNLESIANTVKTDGSAKGTTSVQVAGEDGTNTQTLKTDSDGHLQIDVLTSALPTGAATETTLDAIKTAVEILDNIVSGSEAQVDVVSSALPTGASTLAEQQTQTTHLSEIEGAVETIEGAVSGTEMQVDVVAALPAGTNAIGKLAANSGVDIGDVDVTSLPDSIDGPGAPSIDSYSTAVIDLAAATANQSVISAPGASKQIWVYGVVLTAAAAATVTFQDEDDTALSGTISVAETGGFTLPPSGNFTMPWIKVATNKALEVDTTGAGGTVDGIITYAIVSV